MGSKAMDETGGGGWEEGPSSPGREHGGLQTRVSEAGPRGSGPNTDPAQEPPDRS